jgi:hypothetical protein
MKTFGRHGISPDQTLQTRIGASTQGRPCSAETDENRARHDAVTDRSNVFHEQGKRDSNWTAIVCDDDMPEIKRQIMQKLSLRLERENCFRHLK